jgi:hypothetical protein
LILKEEMELTPIIDWLKANKEWLLSGIGIFIISTLAVMLRSIGYRIWKELIYFRSFDLYISTPVVSLAHQNEFKRHKKTIEELIAILKQSRSDSKIFCYIAEISSLPTSGASNYNIKKIYSTLRRSKKYIGIFPSKVMSGAHCEAGFALALGKPCLFFVKDINDLPTILRKAPSVYSFVNIQLYDSNEDLKRIFQESGKDLFIKYLG